jgi:hypothetical protein
MARAIPLIMPTAVKTIKDARSTSAHKKKERKEYRAKMMLPTMRKSRMPKEQPFRAISWTWII